MPRKHDGGQGCNIQYAPRPWWSYVHIWGQLRWPSCGLQIHHHMPFQYLWLRRQLHWRCITWHPYPLNSCSWYPTGSSQPQEPYIWTWKMSSTLWRQKKQANDQPPACKTLTWQIHLCRPPPIWQYVEDMDEEEFMSSALCQPHDPGLTQKLQGSSNLPWQTEDARAALHNCITDWDSHHLTWSPSQ